MPPARFALYLATAASFGVVLRALLLEPPPAWLPTALLAAYAALLLLGALVPRLEMYGDVLWRAPEAGSLIALTFDDGPQPESTAAVLDLLRQRGAHATFFVLGSRALAYPDLVRRMTDEGHTVGVHSMGHFRAYALLAPSAVQKDLLACRDAVCRAGAPAPVWFRPPVGQMSPRTARGAQRADMAIVGWSVKARDGLRRTTAPQALARVERGLKAGAIVLLHDAWERPAPSAVLPPAGAQALAQILDACKRRGLRPVNLDELVAAAAAHAVLG